VLTDDDALATTLRSLRAHGQGAEKYEIVAVGTNSRLDTLQAAILLGKLSVFADEVEARQRVAARYDERLADRVQVPVIPATHRSAWAQYTVRVDRRDAVAARMRASGVPTAVYYPFPLHRQPAYRDCPVVPGGLPVSTALSQDVLSLPMHPYLDEATQDRIAGTLLDGLA
jgi:dTDP-4-amino-4,6-dideoxygalactose transaminase